MQNETTIQHREGPATSEALIQPLREVGTLRKTKYWSFDEVEDAIREAYRRGIDPHSLFGTATGGQLLAI